LSDEVHKLLEQEFAGKVCFIMLYKSVDTSNRPVFAYFSILPQNVDKLARAIKSGLAFDLNAYAKVLFDGYGEPDDSTIKIIKMMYGIDVSDSNSIISDQKITLT